MFNNAIESQNNTRIIELTKRIHWWMANAMFFDRGSASISDNLTKCIFDFKNIEYGLWKDKLSPDIEAFFLQEDDYVKKYDDFFA